MKPVVVLYLDKRRKKLDETYPIKVKLTLNRKREYYLTGFDSTLKEWEDLNSGRPSKSLREKQQKISGALAKAISIVDNMKIFSFKSFESQFYGQPLEEGSLVSHYKNYIYKLNEAEQVGSAVSYEYSLNSLREYKLSCRLKNKFDNLDSKERIELRDKVEIDFDDITPEFLQAYENWMIKVGNSISSVGFYLRPLRAILNLAKIEKEFYPFGKGKYEIPSSRKTKKAITVEDVRAIIKYSVPEMSMMHRSKDFWVFSYLCNGVNMKDIALLKFSNLDGDYVEFVRAKTKKTTKANQKAIRAYLLPQAREILERWAVKKKTRNGYIFPIIDDEMDAKRKRQVIQQFVRLTNKYMDMIAKELGIQKKVTTYVARHTFSTVLKRSGANTEYIQDALGHTNKKTTEDYLDSFENETIKEHAQKLL